MPDGLNAPRGFNPAADLPFHRILVAVEQTLQTALNQARTESSHGTSIGDGAESAVRDMFRTYLPPNYDVGNGHVYDAFGDCSRESDVVITNPDHPMSFPTDKRGTYVVDGVAAAGEVKAALDLTKLDDCLKKGTAFKQLRMTINDSDRVLLPKDTAYIAQLGLVPPFFLIAFENKIANATLGDRLKNASLVQPPRGKSMGEADAANTPQPPIDAVCILGKGIWMYVRPNNPMGMSIGIEAPDGTKTTHDQAAWAFIETDSPLAWMLAWLNTAMPRIFRGGSVFAPYLIPPMRHLKYMRGQNEEAETISAAQEQSDASYVDDDEEPLPATETVAAE